MKAPAIFVILLVLGIAMFLFFRVRGRTQGISPPQLDDAVRLLWSGKIDQGMSALRLLGEKGNVKAQLFLGHANTTGSPIVKHIDYSEAMKWFKRASSQGSGEGSAAIAELYEQGLGVTNPPKKRRTGGS